MLECLGCYGDSPEDRYREQELDQYLDSTVEEIVQQEDAEKSEDSWFTHCEICGCLLKSYETAGICVRCV